jgi:hypothetical protein
LFDLALQHPIRERINFFQAILAERQLLYGGRPRSDSRRCGGDFRNGFVEQWAEQQPLNFGDPLRRESAVRLGVHPCFSRRRLSNTLGRVSDFGRPDDYRHSSGNRIIPRARHLVA